MNIPDNICENIFAGEFEEFLPLFDLLWTSLAEDDYVNESDEIKCVFIAISLGRILNEAADFTDVNIVEFDYSTAIEYFNDNSISDEEVLSYIKERSTNEYDGFKEALIDYIKQSQIDVVDELYTLFAPEDLFYYLSASLYQSDFETFDFSDGEELAEFVASYVDRLEDLMEMYSDMYSWVLNNMDKNI